MCPFNIAGLYFPKGNPIPYDNRMRCRPENRHLYLEINKGTDVEMASGKTYEFRKQTSMYSPCRIFSVYAKYNKTGEFWPGSLSLVSKTT